MLYDKAGLEKVAKDLQLRSKYNDPISVDRETLIKLLATAYAYLEAYSDMKATVESLQTEVNKIMGGVIDGIPG